MVAGLDHRVSLDVHRLPQWCVLSHQDLLVPRFEQHSIRLSFVLLDGCHEVSHCICSSELVLIVDIHALEVADEMQLLHQTLRHDTHGLTHVGQRGGQLRVGETTEAQLGGRVGQNTQDLRDRNKTEGRARAAETPMSDARWICLSRSSLLRVLCPCCCDLLARPKRVVPLQPHDLAQFLERHLPSGRGSFSCNAHRLCFGALDPLRSFGVLSCHE